MSVPVRRHGNRPATGYASRVDSAERSPAQPRLRDAHPRPVRHTPPTHRFPARVLAPACAEGFEESTRGDEGGDKFGGEGGRNADRCRCFYRHATWSFWHFNVAEAVKNVVEAGSSLCRAEEYGESNVRVVHASKNSRRSRERGQPRAPLAGHPPDHPSFYATTINHERVPKERVEGRGPRRGA